MSDFSSALKGINDSKTSYFVAPATASMTCDTLQKGQKTLTDQIAMWQDRYSKGNSKEKANITAILTNQTAKLRDYSSLISTTCGQPAGAVPTSATGQTPAQQPATGSATTTTPAATTSTSPVAAVATGVVQKVKTALSSVPTWVYEAGGAVLLLGIIVMVVRKKK